MELYTLDETFRRREVVNQFASLIWTERYNSIGDFELEIESNRGNRILLAPGTRLALNLTTRVMVVETTEDRLNADGEALLKVSGRSLESMLEERSSWPWAGGIADNAVWDIPSGLPADICRYIFKLICIDGYMTASDIIPYATDAWSSPPGNIPEPSDPAHLQIEPVSIYESIKKICDVYRLGFRLVRTADDSKLYFNVFTGNDRTSVQSTLPAVIFSPQLENISDSVDLTSQAGFKNVAYVYAEQAFLAVYADNVDPSVAGFERRVLTVKASDIKTAPGPDLTGEMTQRGKEELSKYRAVRGFDGEIPQHGSYTYMKDYWLGDRVEIRNADGLTNEMIVTEQIFVSDSEGERAYPTLSSELLVAPGTWYAWGSLEVWDDAVGVWADY